jgi:tetrahydromethanopterin S-methyltransferase subunit B
MAERGAAERVYESERERVIEHTKPLQWRIERLEELTSNLLNSVERMERQLAREKNKRDMERWNATWRSR